MSGGHPFNFYGTTVVAESGYMPGSIGVAIGGVRMLDRTYAVGQRLAQAGEDGLMVRDVTRTDVELLAQAGHVIERDEMGLRYLLRSDLRSPDAYLVPVQPKPVELSPPGSLVTRRY